MAIEEARPAITSSRARVGFGILVAALGYFVDAYDLLLFNVVRIESLAGIGVTGSEALSKGILLLDLQMAGLLAGGILWGTLGDKRGRVSVLFGSILIYSLATFANGLVHTLFGYAALRCLAGVGLAGELGAGVTLVAESMPRATRGYGTMIVASAGLFGVIVAGLVGDLLPWRTAYFVGGGLGMVLLLLRLGAYESGVFESLRRASPSVARGNFLSLFATRQRAVKYLSVVAVGFPMWMVAGIFVGLAPELLKGLGAHDPPKVGPAVTLCFAGIFVGDIVASTASQLLKSRKRTIGLFLVLLALAMTAYFVFAYRSLFAFHVICVVLGSCAGYWAVLLTTAAESFGTNLRATVTTTVPNIVRGAVIPLTVAFQALKPYLGIRASAGSVAAVALLLAFIGLSRLEETFHKALDYVED